MKLQTRLAIGLQVGVEHVEGGHGENDASSGRIDPRGDGLIEVIFNHGPLAHDAAENCVAGDSGYGRSADGKPQFQRGVDKCDIEHDALQEAQQDCRRGQFAVLFATQVVTRHNGGDASGEANAIEMLSDSTMFLARLATETTNALEKPMHDCVEFRDGAIVRVVVYNRRVVPTGKNRDFDRIT